MPYGGPLCLVRPKRKAPLDLVNHVELGSVQIAVGLDNEVPQEAHHDARPSDEEGRGQSDGAAAAELHVAEHGYEGRVDRNEEGVGCLTPRAHTISHLDVQLVNLQAVSRVEFPVLLGW